MSAADHAAAGQRLAPILRAVAARSQQRRRQRPLSSLRQEVVVDDQRRQVFVAALRHPELAVIAEIKRRSPSAGVLATEVDVAARARAYAEGGASALSILTEQDHFHGDLADLELAASAGLPRLRKDFVLDHGMVLESQLAGADAILLLAVCLPDTLLLELRQLAAEAGLAVLLEIHHPSELERAVAAQPDCLGINARDLTSFEVDLAHIESWMSEVPERFVRVAESGVRTAADAERMRAVGADAVLVGESLMRAADPAALIRALRGGKGGVK